MTLNENIYIRDGFNILNHQNYVFFDIDGTLSSALDELSRIKTDQDCYDYANKLGFDSNDFQVFHVFDLAVPQKSSLEIFAQFLKDTNSKAICTASWLSASKGEQGLNELAKLFSLITNEFPNDWLVGCTNGCCGDRWEAYIEPFKKIHPKSCVIAIDDSAKEYQNKEYSIETNAEYGLLKSDMDKGYNMLNRQKEV